MALNEKEIQTIEKILRYIESKAKDKETRDTCTCLLEKIHLKFYFSPEEEGKLKGLSSRAKNFYYLFYEKYDFDIIDFLGRIVSRNDNPNDLYIKLVTRFPLCKGFVQNHMDEVVDIIRIVISSRHS